MNLLMAETQTRAILLDIEGTTTPVEFVYEVLFPFARLHAGDFLRQHQNSEDVRADIEAEMLVASLRAAEEEVRRNREATQRFEGELAAAQAIQMGLLPRRFPGSVPPSRCRR